MIFSDSLYLAIFILCPANRTFVTGTIPALKVIPKTSAAISLVPCIADATGLTAVGGTTKLAPPPFSLFQGILLA
jgi:hypothetical protein